MPEQETIKGIDEILENLRYSSPQYKDYCKFLIGLSTGTLIFSVTFLKEFAHFPEYKFILIIGWICLLASIIAGVLLLPKSDQLQGAMQNFKLSLKSPEIAGAIIKKEYQQYFLRDWLKTLLGPFFKNDEKKMKEIIKAIDVLPTKELKKFFEGYMLAGVEKPEAIRYVKQFVGEIFKCLSFFEKMHQQISPTILYKNFRIIIRKIIWLHLIMTYGFFVGVFFISLFSIINFLR
jgi:hypothetical protein